MPIFQSQIEMIDPSRATPSNCQYRTLFQCAPSCTNRKFQVQNSQLQVQQHHPDSSTSCTASTTTATTHFPPYYYVFVAIIMARLSKRKQPTRKLIRERDSKAREMLKERGWESPEAEENATAPGLLQRNASVVDSDSE